MGLRHLFSLGLLALVPLSLLAEPLGWGDTAVFLLSAGAILPLALWLSTATEEISISLGPTVGALLNAVFGNAAELIITLTALRAGLVEIVKASITGTVMANLLLALGLAMAAGGIGRSEQRFAPVVARVNGSAMTLALVAILLPSLAALSSGQGSGGDGIPGSGSESFSIFVAWVLLAVYGLTLLFSLGTHRSLYDVAEVELGSENLPAPHGDAATAAEEVHRPPLLPWLAVLLGATAGLTVESELFVGVIETVTERVGLSAVFTGVVLLPLLSGFSEYVTAVTMARRNKMDLAVSVALGATLLVALLVVPVLVLSSPLLGHPIDLRFDLYELVAIITAVALSNLVSLDGRSDWLEGVLLLAAYAILAAGFFYEAGPVTPLPLAAPLLP
ncbi:MAG: calcium/proton exchanger [Cyanobium sp.]